MPIEQLAEYAGESPYLGPPLLNGPRLPYPSYPDGQVTVEWNAEHLVREYGTGRREIVRGARYRPTFTFSFNYLEAIVKVGLWTELKVSPLSFAPYSIKEAGVDLAVPQAFTVLPPETIPDTADLLLARYPFGLTLVGTETFALADIPVVDGSGVPVPGACVYPDAPANLLGTPDEANEEIDWTWDRVQVEGVDVTGYFFEWGETEGGPYPNIARILVADLADPTAPEYSTPAVEGTTYYARVSAYLDN